MASQASFSAENFSCSVCRDIFKHPIILFCSHSFCAACLQDLWVKCKGRKKCPVCNKTNERKHPPSNLALKNLCEAFIQKRQKIDPKEAANESPELLKENDNDADDDKEKEDLSCPVCWDIFKHPVILLCGHSFCKACVQEWWNCKGKRVCPVCKKASKITESPPCNLALKRLCETFVQEKGQKIDPTEAATEPLELSDMKEDDDDEDGDDDEDYMYEDEEEEDDDGDDDDDEYDEEYEEDEEEDVM